MRANNLAISLPNYGCDKNCPYCVSKMTGYLKHDPKLFHRNMHKVLKMAEVAQVNSVILTGKGEPLFNDQSIGGVEHIANFFREYPIEVQTNGIALFNDFDLIESLYNAGVNTIAMSIDSVNQAIGLSPLIHKIHTADMLVRLTFNMTDSFENVPFDNLLYFCESKSVDQMSIRQITVPNNAVNTNVSLRASNWIKENTKKNVYSTMEKEMHEVIKKEGFPLSKLSFGATIYDIHGVAVTMFDHCIQESNESDDIRSLIYQEDGHLYYTWDSSASKIF